MHNRLARVLVLGLVLVAALLGGATSAWGADEESWYVVQISGKKAGHMVQTVRTGDGTITTSSTMALKIRRDTSVIAVTLSSAFVETVDHTPVSMRSEQAIGAGPELVEYRFTPAGVEVTRGPAEKRTKEIKPRPEGDWLTPAAAAAATARAIADGRRSFVVRSIDPASGLAPITTTYTVGEKTTARALGREVPGVEWVTSVDKYPGVKSREVVDLSGRAVRSTTSVGGLELVIVLADRELAMVRAEPPELLNSSMITPDRAIGRPRDAARATYIVSTREEAMPDLPSIGGQVATRLDARRFRVSVDRARGSEPEGGEAGDAALLAPSAMITSRDAAVVRLAERAVAGLKDAGPGERAESLRRGVHGLITKKDLDVGFASAAETARTLSGDCTEHAVLLAAMLRSQKIPSRVVSGLVYVERGGGAGGGGVFGYHMWTQALIDGERGPRWIDLDATLGPGTPTDATHIGLVVSTLSDEGMSNDLVRLVPLLGTLEIRVEAVEPAEPGRGVGR